MKVLAVHNYYQMAGGEDTAYAAEVALLRRHGHDVVTYERSNSEIHKMSALQKANVPLGMTWNQRAYSEVKKALQAGKPDLVHFHNTHMLISPAAYYACRSLGIPVVQSLDNPRLMCPSANLFRDGHHCEDCLGKVVPWPGVLHACYRGSRLQTGAVAAMLTTHRVLNTWDKCVDLYLVATEFYKQKFIQGGLPAEKLFVKPHFVDPDPASRAPTAGDYALFIGRLDSEKGIATLLRAWEQLPDIPLRIRGDGQMMAMVADAAAVNREIQVVDRVSKEGLTNLIKGARFLVWPSEGIYETFGFVAAEAFACGVPVVASAAGVQQEMVADGKTGLLFRQSDPADLAAKARWAWDHPDEVAALGKNARGQYECRYTASATYPQLMEAYASAIARSPARQQSASTIAKT